MKKTESCKSLARKSTGDRIQKKEDRGIGKLAELIRVRSYTNSRHLATLAPLGKTLAVNSRVPRKLRERWRGRNRVVLVVGDALTANPDREISAGGVFGAAVDVPAYVEQSLDWWSLKDTAFTPPVAFELIL